MTDINLTKSLVTEINTKINTLIKDEANRDLDYVLDQIVEQGIKELYTFKYLGYHGGVFVVSGRITKIDQSGQNVYITTKEGFFDGGGIAPIGEWIDKKQIVEVSIYREVKTLKRY